jgi:hypothetical protein
MRWRKRSCASACCSARCVGASLPSAAGCGSIGLTHWGAGRDFAELDAMAELLWRETGPAAADQPLIRNSS